MSVEVTMADLAKALSDGLDLCARARKMDAQDRTNAIVEVAKGEIDLEQYAPRHNAINPDQPISTRSWTIPLWVQEQYERDLASWERESSALLSRLPMFQP